MGRLPIRARALRNPEVWIESPPILLELHGPTDPVFYRGLYALRTHYIEFELEAWFVGRFESLRTQDLTAWKDVWVALYFHQNPLGVFVPDFEEEGQFCWARLFEP